jgi:hypothetical protein
VSDNACHVTCHVLVPHLLSSTAPYDVVSIIYQALGRGVTRSKRRSVQFCRQAAENGLAEVERCRLTVSVPELKALMVSALEASIR